MNIRIEDVRSLLWVNRIWVAVVLMMVVSLILLLVLVRPMSEKVKGGIDMLEGDKVKLAEYAKMSPQSIPAEKVLENEESYVGALEAQLNKMRQTVGKGDFKWAIASLEPGKKYPDPRKFKLEYNKAKPKLIKEWDASLVQFANGTLTGLFWDIRGEPSPEQMLIIQKEFSIVKTLLDIITDPKTAVSYVHILAVNPGETKIVHSKPLAGVIRAGEKPPAAAPGAYKKIPIKLVLDIDYRTLNLLLDGILRSPYKFNLNVSLIERLGMIGDTTVEPLVRVDMDVESVDFNPVL